MRDWLKKMRIEKQLTQLQMAEKLDITESYYSLIERGDRQKEMDISLASKLSTVLGVSVQDIIEQETAAPPSA